jgi:hypothetical protein
MRRRKFIVLTTAAGAALGVSYWYLKRHYPDSYFILATPESLLSIWDKETVDSIGSRYRKQWPEEHSETSLQKILDDLADNGPDKEKALKLAIQEDFKKGDTVIIDGWILARTEARQCALYSLIKN